MKKIFALLLCLVLIAVCFAACGRTEEEQSKDEPVSADRSAVTSEENSEPASEEDPIKQILDDPNIYKGSDYTGRVFKVLSCRPPASPLSEIVYNEGVGEETMSETVNEAIKRRNDKVFDLLGVTIEDEYFQPSDRYGGQALYKIRQIISDADNSYSMISACLYDCGTLALSGELWDLNSLDNINMDNPWWEQYFNESVEIAGQLFFTGGDMGIYMKEATPVVFFNAKLIEDLGLEDPVAVANRGEWTIDKALEYSKTMPHEDLPATQQYLKTFGWAGEYDDMHAMLYCSGTRILSRDGEGYLTLTLNTETAINAIDKILSLMCDSSYVCGNYMFSVTNSPMIALREAFEQNRCLFYSDHLYRAPEINMDATFGILPVPKLTVEQEHYYSLVNTWASNAYCIGANLGKEDAEFAAAVMDVMGYYSWVNYPDSVAYNYYEKMLKNQKLTREDFEAMLDLIFEGRGCELGAIFQIGQKSARLMVNDMLTKLVDGKDSQQFTSMYEQYKNAFETDTE
ncbi:MAG: hypothetical protein IKX49_00270, partial [Clostridia bacterium]|nr:hypothetical protein [Clostridia bacterium]